MSRFVRLGGGYIADVDRIQEVIFRPANGTTTAKVTVVMIDDESTTELHDDDAITVWHRMLDLCEPTPAPHRGDAR